MADAYQEGWSDALDEAADLVRANLSKTHPVTAAGIVNLLSNMKEISK
jgi:hypothetical protein